MVLGQKLGVERRWEDKLKKILSVTTRSRLYGRWRCGMAERRLTSTKNLYGKIIQLQITTIDIN